MRIRMIFVAALAMVLLAAVVFGQGRGNQAVSFNAPSPGPWPTAYGDAQRSSWVRTDTSISIESMSRPGFALQWKTKLESPARQGISLTQGVVSPGVTLFTPLSTVAGPANLVFAIDNDTGNVFWSRHFEGQLPAGTAACPGGISGAPTRTVNLVVAPLPLPRGAGRGGRGYSSVVGEPGEGVPSAPQAGFGGAGRAQAAPAPAQPPASPAV